MRFAERKDIENQDADTLTEAIERVAGLKRALHRHDRVNALLADDELLELAKTRLEGLRRDQATQALADGMANQRTAISRFENKEQLQEALDELADHDPAPLDHYPATGYLTRCSVRGGWGARIWNAIFKVVKS